MPAVIVALAWGLLAGLVLAFVAGAARAQRYADEQANRWHRREAP